MIKAKYIRTKNNTIIVFSGAIEHTDFKSFEPVSAGFINIGVFENQTTCGCYGESVGLGLHANSIIDTELADMQILNNLP